jgi:hypothetical protein
MENSGKNYLSFSTCQKQLVIILQLLEDFLFFCGNVSVYKPAE